MRFGTDGIRGPAGRSPIDRDGARAVGAAAARWALGRGGVVLVGRDTRPSGDELAGEVMQGVLQAGGRPLDCGVLPTPALQAAVAALGDAGVMVTASHNPADDNGFKVLGPGGHKPNDAETADLESWLATPAVGCGGAVAVATNEAVAAWAATFARALGDPSPLRGRRVAVDCANGAAAAVRGAVGALLPGVEILWLSTGDGVINAGVGSEHPEALAARVRAEGLDAGFAVDGDGDRCVVVDEAGRVVPGDALLWRLAVDRGARRLVVTVMSNTALEASLPGVEVVRTPVGDRHVAAALGDAPVGGEESGHVLLAGGGPRRRRPADGVRDAGGVLAGGGDGVGGDGAVHAVPAAADQGGRGRACRPGAARSRGGAGRSRSGRPGRAPAGAVLGHRAGASGARRGAGRGPGRGDQRGADGAAAGGVGGVRGEPGRAREAR